MAEMEFSAHFRCKIPGGPGEADGEGGCTGRFLGDSQRNTCPKVAIVH